MKSSMKLIWAAVIAFAGSMLLPTTALADFDAPGLYIGAYGGYMLKLGDWQLGETNPVFNKVAPLNPKSAPVLGARLGWHFTPRLICEIGGGYLPLESEVKNSSVIPSGVSNNAVKGDLDLYFQLLRGNFSPFIGLGGGLFQSLSGGDLGSDFDGQAHATLGIRGLISPKIALRAEVRDYLVEDYSSAKYGQNLEITGGIDFYLFGGKKQKAVPSDRDKDGIVDVEDKCPDEAGTAAMQGCPDRDKDGIVDATDKCPDDPGTAELQGCPDLDKDKDGIADAQDKCPYDPGTAELQGCPDLDKDKDGIADTQDKCPDLAGPKMTDGCPDKDDDGIADMNDSCPDVRGLPEYKGCVPVAVAKFTGAIKGINFSTGSATILPNSFGILDQAVAVMNEYNSLRLAIDGHTDNVGSAELNQKLSESRAASVKTYLVSKGIDESRLQTAGYGDTKPLEDNKTAAGRAANRRIEFSIQGQ